MPLLPPSPGRLDHPDHPRLTVSSPARPLRFAPAQNERLKDSEAVLEGVEEEFVKELTLTQTRCDEAEVGRGRSPAGAPAVPTKVLNAGSLPIPLFFPFLCILLCIFLCRPRSQS